MALTLGACSGGSDDGGDRSSPTTARDAAPTTVDTTFSGQGSEQFCSQIRAYADGTRQLSEAQAFDVRLIYTEAARAVSESAAIAPPEIRRDVEVVAEAFSTLVTELEAVNYDFERLPAPVALRFMSEELTTATARVEAYSRSVCRVSG